MASIDWPVSLPATLRHEGLEIEPVDPTIETDTDAGAKQKRRKYTRIQYNVNGSLVLLSSLVDVLDEFWRVTTGAGVLRFNWTHPRTGQPVTAQFAAPPKPRAAGRLSIVSLELRIWL